MIEFTKENPCRCSFDGIGFHRCHAGRYPLYPGDQCEKEAKQKILDNYKFSDLRIYNKYYLNNIVREDNKPNGKIVQFDLKTKDCYAYIVNRISDNDNYKGIDWKGDTDLENLWQKELDRLAGRNISDL